MPQKSNPSTMCRILRSAVIGSAMAALAATAGCETSPYSTSKTGRVANFAHLELAAAAERAAKAREEDAARKRLERQRFIDSLAKNCFAAADAESEAERRLTMLTEMTHEAEFGTGPGGC